MLGKKTNCWTSKQETLDEHCGGPGILGVRLTMHEPLGQLQFTALPLWMVTVHSVFGEEMKLNLEVCARKVG